MAENEKINKLTKSTLYKDIKKDLLEQLKINGTDGKHYIDLVNDYMNMWVTKSLLKEDIEERGVNVQYNNGGGQYGYKKNDSVDQILKVNQQMLKLLSELGIKPSKKDGDSNGADEEM